MNTMRMLRWGYILPRLALLAALYWCCEHGLALVLRPALVAAGQGATGAKVEVAELSASVFTTRLAARGIALADPADPMRNLVEADLVEMDFDAGAALHKRGVVETARVTGLRFGTPRQTSGQLPEAPTPEPSATSKWATDRAGKLADQWLDDLSGRFTADLDRQFESVRLAQELRTKWPAEYAGLEIETRRLHDEIKQYERELREARKNPLRNAETISQAPATIGRYRAELKALKERVAALPRDIAADRARVQEARAHDEARVREALASGAIDAASLSEYLLGERVTGPMHELIGWLRFARSLAPAKPKAPEPEAQRGVDVLLAGTRREPSLLIKRVALEGAAQVAGRHLQLAGAVTGVTNDPRLLGQPLVMTLTTSGALPIEAKVTVDRTGDAPRDELLADCPAVAVGAMQLGRPDRFALAIEPSEASVSVSVLLEGESLSGDIQFVQERARVTPQVGVSLGDVLSDADLRDALTKGLEDMPKLATRVTLSGTLDDPQWKVWSTAGPAVAEALDRAVRGLARSRAERALAGAKEAVEGQLASLDAEVSQAAERLGPTLAGPAEALKAIGANAAGSALGGLGSKLPLDGSLFK